TVRAERKEDLSVHRRGGARSRIGGTLIGATDFANPGFPDETSIGCAAGPHGFVTDGVSISDVADEIQPVAHDRRSRVTPADVVCLPHESRSRGGPLVTEPRLRRNAVPLRASPLWPVGGAARSAYEKQGDRSEQPVFRLHGDLLELSRANHYRL